MVVWWNPFNNREKIEHNVFNDVHKLCDCKDLSWMNDFHINKDPWLSLLEYLDHSSHVKLEHLVQLRNQGPNINSVDVFIILFSQLKGSSYTDLPNESPPTI